MTWHLTGIAGADVAEVTEQLQQAYDREVEPGLRGHIELARASREQFGLAVDQIAAMIESGTLGQGPFDVTLTGNATAGHQQSDGDRQFVSIGVAGRVMDGAAGLSRESAMTGHATSGGRGS